MWAALGPFQQPNQPPAKGRPEHPPEHKPSAAPAGTTAAPPPEVAAAKPAVAAAKATAEPPKDAMQERERALMDAECKLAAERRILADRETTLREQMEKLRRANEALAARESASTSAAAAMRNEFRAAKEAAEAREATLSNREARLAEGEAALERARAALTDKEARLAQKEAALVAAHQSKQQHYSAAATLKPVGVAGGVAAAAPSAHAVRPPTGSTVAAAIAAVEMRPATQQHHQAPPAVPAPLPRAAEAKGAEAAGHKRPDPPAGAKKPEAPAAKKPEAPKGGGGGGGGSSKADIKQLEEDLQCDRTADWLRSDVLAASLLHQHTLDAEAVFSMTEQQTCNLSDIFSAPRVRARAAGSGEWTPVEGAAAKASARSGKWQLKGMEGDYQGQFLPLPAVLSATGMALLGRSSSCDVTFSKDDQISRRHLKLEAREGSLFVSDLGSTYGTRINGKTVGADPALLRQGDVLGMGTSTFQLQLAS